MIRALPALAALLVLAPAASAATPTIHAHRGGSVLAGAPTYPENTLPAFRNAARKLHAVLEIDTRITADDVPVVLHDATLDRTTDCEGVVREKTLAQLRDCRADVLGSPGNDLKTKPAPKPVPIPTLAEVLALARSSGSSINLEIDHYPNDEGYEATDTHANRVMDVLLESGLPARRVIMQSFTPDNLEVAESRMPKAEFALNTLHGLNDLGLDVADEHDWDWISPEWPVDRAYIEEAHDRGLRVAPFTPNTPRRVRDAARFGADALITDDPLMALRTLDTRAPVVKVELLSRKLRAVRRSGHLLVRLSTNEAATVALNLSLAGRTIAIDERFDTAAARKLVFGLPRSVRRALRSRDSVRVRLNAKFRDTAGNDGRLRTVAELR